MPGVPNFRKRLSESPGLDEDGASTSTKRQRVGRQPRRDATLQNGTAERHKPGSIVRVKMINFVTYTNAEFHLGPSLNMVIGPNGTGKSSLVCAICLGLGWGPQHLGRAKELGEFVKHGAREADIEIELAGEPGNRNSVIRRNIKRENNKSTFYINGALSSNKAARDLAKSFHIQVDNLCQFLPQDRVVEFAALSPVDLLTATQQAAADGWMLEHHEALKKLRTAQKQGLANNLQSKEQLQNLKNRQNAQEKDVQRMAEREAVLVKISAFQKFKPFIQYRSDKQRLEEAKVERKQAAEELERLQRQERPALDAMKAKDDYQKSIEKVVAQRKLLMERADRTCEEVYRRQQNLQDKIDECGRRVEAEKDGDRKRKSELARVNNAIASIKRQMDIEPIEFDAAAYNEQIRDRQRQQRDLTTQLREILEYFDGLKNQVKERRILSTQHEQELESLHSQSGQQENKLRKQSRDTAQAWKWVQENQEMFRGRIYGPPIVSCSVKDPRYANAIESMLQNNDFLTFTCESREDYKILQEQLYTKLRLSDITIRVANRPLTHWQSPVSKDELSSHDLDGWLVDFVEGPDAVLSMLCDSARLHKTGITLSNHSNAQFERLKESAIQSWVAGKQTYQVTRRREYGPKAVSVMVRSTRSARFWTEQAVDTSAESELRRKIAEIQDELNQLKTQAEERKVEQGRLKEKIGKLSDEEKELSREKAEKQKVVGEFQALPMKLRTNEERKNALDEAGSLLKNRLKEVEQEKTKLVVQKGQAALDYAISVETLRKMHTDLFEAEIREIEAKSEAAISAEHNKEVLERRRAKEQEVTALKNEEVRIREQCTKLRDQLKKCQTESSPEELEVQRDLNEQHPNLLAADLDGLIEETKARLTLLHEGDPNTVKQFENRAKEIRKLEERVAGLEDNLEGLQGEIDEKRAQWEPALDQLVSQISDAFSYNFSKIGCAGQVGIHKDEDFDQWAIQIQVKFRENEPLSILDAHRQSGGERAVSTIFYLMALQSRAKSPFRVVDEINQGMDPRNERLVHERMVDIACQENTSQYFLITPKLLHGLKFHPRMKVHTIMSGEYMPTDNRKLDVVKMAERALEIRARA